MQYVHTKFDSARKRQYCTQQLLRLIITSAVECPFYGLDYSTNLLCVSKKWWDILPINSDQ